MKINIQNKKVLLTAVLLLSALLTEALLPLLSQTAEAASLTHSYIRETRMKTGVTSDLRVVFKTVTAGATGYTIDFNGADTTTWTGSSGSVTSGGSGWTVANVSGCDVSATAPSGSAAASGSGSVLTISGVTALSANTTYCWDITHTGTAVTNPTAGEYHPIITETGGATDTTSVSLDIVANDQITVNASVTPVFNLAISAGCASNQDNFSSALSFTTHRSTAGCTWTVNTNAANGWFAWAKDSGLTSVANGHSIAGASTASVSDLNTTHGTEGYGLGITAVSNGGSCATGVTCGTVSSNAIYDSTASASKVGGLDATLRNIVSSTGPNNAATFGTIERANINATTPAATDYSDTITLVGAGYF